MFGIVPGCRYGWPKNVLHWAGIHELAQLFAAVLNRSSARQPMRPLHDVTEKIASVRDRPESSLVGLQVLLAHLQQALFQPVLE